jgi:hypothetical protein
MNELESSIGSLKKATLEGYTLLAKLERGQKDLEESKVPVFPDRFMVVKDNQEDRHFLIGLKLPSTANLTNWSELPADFVGRVGFTADDLRQIIMGIQTLLGESNG